MSLTRVTQLFSHVSFPSTSILVAQIKVYDQYRSTVTQVNSYFTSVVPANFTNLLAVPVRAYLFPQEVDFNDLKLPIHFPRRETEH